MLASSSKRALSSTTAVTDLPASAASFSASMIGEVFAGAVERPFDRHHVGVGRRLLQELQHDVERFVGVMDDDVLLADGGEAIALMLADALRKPADIGLKFEVGPVGDDQLIGIGKPDQALLHETLAPRRP